MIQNNYPSSRLVMVWLQVKFRGVLSALTPHNIPWNLRKFLCFVPALQVYGGSLSFNNNLPRIKFATKPFNGTGSFSNSLNSLAWSTSNPTDSLCQRTNIFSQRVIVKCGVWSHNQVAFLWRSKVSSSTPWINFMPLITSVNHLNPLSFRQPFSALNPSL